MCLGRAAIAGTAAPAAGGVRVPPRRHARLCRRLGRPPCAPLRSLRAAHCDRAVRTARRAGHDDGALCLGRHGLLDVDNGSSHAGRASIERLEGRWRNLHLIHLPIHASWLNQIELYFSILQRKALSPNDFASLAELEQRLLTFGRHYRKIAEPFAWSFTRQDLDRVLRAIDTHEPQLALAA